MPVEIRELIIRAVVEPRNGGSSPADSRAEPPSASRPVEDTADIVQACVREVLRILAAQKER